LSLGWGSYLQLGHGDNDDRSIPTLVEEFEDSQVRVKEISCGGWHSVCVSGIYLSD
jgi:hypothetical protein